MGFVADRCLAVNDDVRIEPHSVAQNNLAPDRAKRSYVTALAQFGSIGDDRGFVYIAGHQARLVIDSFFASNDHNKNDSDYDRKER